MPFSNRSSRREFMQIAGITAGAAGLGLSTSAAAFGQAEVKRDADSVLAHLVEGNKRFVSGKLEHPGRRPEDFVPLAEGQAPLAAIVACADSRVAPELVFDQGIGDLFVVRVAGNVAADAGPVVKGSLEFAVAEPGVKLILVLGHSQCGAVKAAIEHIEKSDQLPGSIGNLVALIQPAVIAAKGQPGDKLTNVIKANVLKCVERIKVTDPILSKAVKSGGLKVVGGAYELRTGKVDLFE